MEEKLVWDYCNSIPFQKDDFRLLSFIKNLSSGFKLLFFSDIVKIFLVKTLHKKRENSKLMY